MLVMKFGGTSVGSPEAMSRSVDLIRRSRKMGKQVVAVASAMGTRPVKVTDLLLQGAHTAASGDAETYRQVADSLRQVHREVIRETLQDTAEQEQVWAEVERLIDRFSDLCSAVFVLGELTARALDAISAMGEQMSVRILAAALREAGVAAQAVDATELIVTDDAYQSATPLLEETTRKSAARLLPLLAHRSVPVVTGFIGATQAGVTTTLGRGGSDFSAALLGQALSAEEVWIWTDVDGIMTTDPRLVPGARTIPTLSYREVAELAFFGAGVLHPKTIRPCLDSGIPLRIKNTFNPEHAGTLIVPDAGAEQNGMKAVTAIEELSLITVEGKGMIGVPGIAARTFGAVARHGVNVLLISQASSEQSISFAIPEARTETVIGDLEAAFAVELNRRDIDSVWALRPVSIVTIVGAGMRGTPGIAGRIFGALGAEGVNIIAIAQGSSECSISMVVDEVDTIPAVRYIHALL